MEFIFDEIKQHIIKKVNDFENQNENYLLVYFSDEMILDKNASRIVLITNPEFYKREYGYINFIKDNFKGNYGQLNELYMIDKKIDLIDIFSIKNYILSDSTITEDIKVYSYLGKNNYMICKSKS